MSPRGNPNFGRLVKSPGRPKKPDNDDGVVTSAQADVDRFLRKNIMGYVKVQHDIAMNKLSDDKVRLVAAENLTGRLLGKIKDRRDTEQNALVGLVRELIGLGVPKPVIQTEPPVDAETKELTVGVSHVSTE